MNHNNWMASDQSQEVFFPLRLLDFPLTHWSSSMLYTFNQLLESSRHSPLAYAITFSLDLCLFVAHLEGLHISLSLQINSMGEISWESLVICLEFHGGRKVGYQCSKCISCTFSFALLYNPEKINSPWEVIMQRNRKFAEWMCCPPFPHISLMRLTGNWLSFPLFWTSASRIGSWAFCSNC